jgi:hypothetical protein
MYDCGVSCALRATKPVAVENDASSANSAYAIGSGTSVGTDITDSPSSAISISRPNWTVSSANDCSSSNDLNRTPAAIQFSPSVGGTQPCSLRYVSAAVGSGEENGLAPGLVPAIAAVTNGYCGSSSSVGSRSERL